MKVLISPISMSEAQAVIDGGADIIDVKNINEGSLGASFPWIIRGIVDRFKNSGVLFSATLGDLPHKPGTASLAALGAAASGAQYIKAGLHGTTNYEEAAAVMSAVVRACRDFDPDITVVAAGYADNRRFSGLDPRALVRAAADSKADLVMLDTAVKDGRTLFDALKAAELRNFIDHAKSCGLLTALAGSVRFEHIETIRDLGADVVGVRGAVCEANDRKTGIRAELVRRFVKQCRAGTAAA